MNTPMPLAVPPGFDPKAAHVEGQWPTEHPVVCCRFDPKGRFVFCGVEHSTIQRINLADGKRAAFPAGHDSWVFSFAFTKDGARVFSGGGDGRVTEWETDASGTPKPIRRTQAHQGWIRSMEVSPDGALLATGANDRSVKLWDTAKGTLVRELTGHKGHVYSVEFHPNGKSVFSGDLLGDLREWDIASGKLLGAYEANPLHSYNGGQQVDFGGIRGLAISADAKFIAAGGLHKASNPLGAVHEPLVLVFDTASRKKLKTQLADGITQGVIWRLRFLADGSVMGVTGGGTGGLLLFWKTDAEKDYFRFKLPSIARDMDLHPDGLRVATGHFDRQLRVTRLAAKAAKP